MSAGRPSWLRCDRRRALRLRRDSSFGFRRKPGSTRAPALQFGQTEQSPGTVRGRRHAQDTPPPRSLPNNALPEPALHCLGSEIPALLPCQTLLIYQYKVFSIRKRYRLRPATAPRVSPQDKEFNSVNRPGFSRHPESSLHNAFQTLTGCAEHSRTKQDALIHTRYIRAPS
ncbi:hypothetical protein D9M69_618030 [compost metagenome]